MQTTHKNWGKVRNMQHSKLRQQIKHNYRDACKIDGMTPNEHKRSTIPSLEIRKGADHPSKVIL